MVATSRRLIWESGSKKSTPPNTLIRNQSIIAGTRVPDTTSLTTLATRARAIAGHVGPSGHADPDCLPVPKDDGWNASRELPPVFPGRSSTPQSSWQPECAMKPWVLKRHFLNKPTEPQEGTPMVVESLDTPAPSTSCVRDSIHPVQFSIFSNRLLLPHPDDDSIWLRRSLAHARWVYCLGAG